MALKSTQDAAAGLVFMAIGLGGLWFGRDLETGSASFMQAGYMPRLACILLIGLSAILLVRGFQQGGPALTSWAWRPFLVITGAVAIFGALIVNAGLVATSIVMVALLSRAGHPPRPLDLILMTFGLTALMVGLFHYGLRLPIPVWPV